MNFTHTLEIDQNVNTLPFLGNENLASDHTQQ